VCIIIIHLLLLHVSCALRVAFAWFILFVVFTSFLLWQKSTSDHFRHWPTISGIF